MMRYPIRFYGLIVAVAALAGCNGNSDSTSSAPPGASTAAPSGPTLVMPTDPHAQIAGTPAAGVNDAPSPGCYSATVPRRLTRTQYVNALTDWSNALISDGGIGARIQTLVIDTAQFPIDASTNPESSRHQGYYRLDPTVTTRQVTGVYTVAQALAADLASSDARVATLLGNCTGEACLNAFIRKAGRVLFRQPLSDAEVAVYRKAAGSATDRAGITRLLATMIASPQSYYLLERGDTSDNTATACVALTPHELAARLSLHLWDTIPDAQLRADADSAALLQPSVYADHIRRLMADPRADAALRSFFRQWFRLDELVALNGKVGNARFDAFAGSFRPLSTTRDAAINDVLDMVSYVSARNGSLQQVLSDRHSFARTADLAELYKTTVWNGSGTPPTFAEAERVGLLTRVGLIANGSTDTTLPIQRGIKILSALTCQALPAPAMNQTNMAADLSGVLSTRERTERVTQMEGTTCIGCHQAVINPWGFVFEGFDALGRVRSTEVVRNDAGASVGQKPIDAGVMAGLGSLATRPMSTAAQAQQYVLESGEFERCFARNYFRYAFGRTDIDSDAEVIETVRRQAVNGANLRSLFASIVTRDEFKSIQRPQ